MQFTLFKYLISFQRYSSFQNMQISQVMKSYTQPNLIKYDEKGYLSQFLSEMFDFFCSKIQLNVLHNLSLTVLLTWQHTGFQTSPILKAFPTTFGISFSYLQMVPHRHDPTSIQMC